MKTTNYFPKLFLSISFLLISRINAQSPDWIWAKSIGGAGGDDRSSSISLDESSNVYTVGAFAGTVDFDPGPGIYNLNGTGNNDMFISKLDSTGNFIWAKGIFGTDGIIGRAIVTDTSNNIYVAGYFSGIADFDPGPATVYLNSAYHVSGFILKLSDLGNLQWIKMLNGNAGLRGIGDEKLFLSLDNLRNIYLTGNYYGTIDFNPDSSIVTNRIAIGGNDIFIAKFDNSGNLIWVNSIGGAYEDAGCSMVNDVFNNIYVTGYFYGSVDFDPGVTGVFTITSRGTRDMFILKLNSSGQLVWAKGIGGSGYEVGSSISINSDFDIYVTGYYTFVDSVDFDPDTVGIFNLPSSGTGENYISKYDSAGNFIWAKNFGNFYWSRETYLSLDDLSNVYITAAYDSLSDLDPGIGALHLPSKGSVDICIIKLDSSGNYYWATVIGGETFDFINCPATISQSSRIYFTGNYYSSVISNDSIAIFNSGNNTHSDIIIAMLDSQGIVLNTGRFGALSEVLIFPNPANGNFTIDLKNINKEALVFITEITGKPIYCSKSIGNHTEEINTTNFSNGIYLVQIKSDDFVETKKIIISK